MQQLQNISLLFLLLGDLIVERRQEKWDREILEWHAELPVCVSVCVSYLSRQQSGQVDLRNHLAASVSFSLITVLMILHQVPQFSS